MVEERVTKAVEGKVGGDALERGKMARGGVGAGSTGLVAGETHPRKHPCAWYRGGMGKVRHTEQHSRAQGGKGTWFHWTAGGKGWANGGAERELCRCVRAERSGLKNAVSRGRMCCVAARRYAEQECLSLLRSVTQALTWCSVSILIGFVLRPTKPPLFP
jgi:hypothetical protein